MLRIDLNAFYVLFNTIKQFQHNLNNLPFIFLVDIAGDLQNEHTHSDVFIVSVFDSLITSLLIKLNIIFCKIKNPK